VRAALERDGWTVTADPLVMRIGRRNMFIDLGAERIITAERGAERIAVEVKSFLGESEIVELEAALGQYVLYERLLRRKHPDRTLWLAVPSHAWSGIFREAVGDVLLEDGVLRLIVVNEERKEIERWIPSTSGAR
jgi:hypothetical protein